MLVGERKMIKEEGTEGSRSWVQGIGGVEGTGRRGEY
jgi:hypothetical protein